MGHLDEGLPLGLEEEALSDPSTECSSVAVSPPGLSDSVYVEALMNGMRGLADRVITTS